MIDENSKVIQLLPPTWKAAWVMWRGLNKIDQNTYELFLPVMKEQDRRNAEDQEKQGNKK